MNRPLRRFLENQAREGLDLAARCPLLDLEPLEPAPVSRYVAHFGCRGLTRAPDGRVVEAEGFVVGIRFPDHYLERTSSFEVLTLLEPGNPFHPNARVGLHEGHPVRLVCIGTIRPGMPLKRILMQVHDVLRGWCSQTNERDALDYAACRWYRNHPERLPVDPRVLTWTPDEMSATEGKV